MLKYVSTGIINDSEEEEEKEEKESDVDEIQAKKRGRGGPKGKKTSRRITMDTNVDISSPCYIAVSRSTASLPKAEGDHQEDCAASDNQHGHETRAGNAVLHIVEQ